MCKKIEDMRDMAMAQGEEIGREKGEISGTLKTLIALVKDGLISVAEGAKRANLTIPEFEAKLAQA